MGGVSRSTAPDVRIARWGHPPCRANRDGSLSPGGCPTLSAADFTCFLNAFASGCPGQ